MSIMVLLLANPPRTFRIGLVCALALFSGCTAVRGQCTNFSPFGTAPAPVSTTPLLINTCTSQMNYNTVNGVVSGRTYVVGSSCGGYVTVRHTTFSGTVVAHGNAPLTFTAPVSGAYYLHFNTNAACGQNTACCTTTITCTSCSGAGNCLNAAASATLAAPVFSGNTTISSCTTPGQYDIITGVVAGRTYSLTNFSCGGGGYLTVRHTTVNGTIAAQGVPTPSLVFVAPVSGTYFLHWSANTACGTNTTCCTTAINCASCPPAPPPGACTAVNIPSLPVTGQALICHAGNLISNQFVTANCTNTGSQWLTGSEALYTVTPVTTGHYAITVMGQPWTSIWVFSGACPVAGGNCIGSIGSETTSKSLSVELSAGVQYWIIIDTYGPNPPAPCPGTFSISAVSPPVVASDCGQAVNVCSNGGFQTDPNGFGSVLELPSAGSASNPLFQVDGIPSPWGTDNSGCLQAGELNSTWMIVNVLTGGSLAFTFGGSGSQSGFYDWAMYPYNANACAQVSSGLVAPVRCNWNGVSYGGTGLAAPLPPGGHFSNFEPPITVASLTQWLICFSNWSSVTTYVPISFGGTAVVSCGVVLPLELISLTAEPDGPSVLLHWRTGSEQGTDHFEVQRSEGILDHTPIGRVEAAGNSVTERAYTFRDEAPPQGSVYYRLRMVDTDGAERFSPMVHVLRHPAAPLVFPNPANGAFLVRTEGRALEVLDALGRGAPYERVDAMDGSVEVRLQGARPGLYTVRVGGAGGPVARVLLVD
jgi:hypothetical protein